jgi:hypothetical protein
MQTHHTIVVRQNLKMSEKKRNLPIIKSVESEILNPTVDLSIDYAEIALDSFLDNDAISEIPIVKSIVGIAKIGISIKERHDLKKLLTFFKEFQSGNISDENRLAFNKKFNSNEKYRTEVVETIVLLNERFLDLKKSKILANLMNAHINHHLTWNELNDISIILDNIHPKAFLFLKEMAEKNWSHHDRHNENEPLMFSCGIGNKDGSKFSISKMGQDLFNYGIKPLLNE